MYPRPELSQPTPQEIFYRTPQRLVLIKHPGVDKILFSFPALSTGDADISFGVSRSLVQDACRVLTNRAANNQADFLALDKEGQNPIGDNVTLLHRDCYYFLGPPNVEVNRNYPIVGTLSAFRFPSVLPGAWKEIADTLRQSHPTQWRRPPASSQMSGDVGRRDYNCVITKCAEATKCTHIIPKSEEDWFVAHGMGTYVDVAGSAGINHPTNGLLLRADVRICLDSHGFVFYPDNDPVSGPRFVAYFVAGGWSSFFPDLLHRRLVAIHPEIPTEFLYARFAYAIINQPRENAFFTFIDEWDEVKKVRSGREGQKRSAKKTGTSQGSRSTLGSSSDGSDDPDVDSPSTGSNRSIQPPREETTEGNERWRKFLFERFPELSQLPEVEDPPDTFTGSHVETPHMMRLRSEYVKQHPEVWRTSTMPADATREDVEGFYADSLTRPV